MGMGCFSFFAWQHCWSPRALLLGDGCRLLRSRLFHPFSLFSPCSLRGVQRAAPGKIVSWLRQPGTLPCVRQGSGGHFPGPSGAVNLRASRSCLSFSFLLPHFPPTCTGSPPWLFWWRWPQPVRVGQRSAVRDLAICSLRAGCALLQPTPASKTYKCSTLSSGMPESAATTGYQSCAQRHDLPGRRWLLFPQPGSRFAAGCCGPCSGAAIRRRWFPWPQLLEQQFRGRRGCGCQVLCSPSGRW